eukprot:1794687-Pyramimonas_sp.AAC.1
MGEPYAFRNEGFRKATPNSCKGAAFQGCATRKCDVAIERDNVSGQTCEALKITYIKITDGSVY